jgi:hypothetical protein
MDPALCSEGDEGEWAMVKMVRGKLPISSFSAKAGNPEIHSAKNGPPLFSDNTGIQNLSHPEWLQRKRDLPL